MMMMTIMMIMMTTKRFNDNDRRSDQLMGLLDAIQWMIEWINGMEWKIDWLISMDGLLLVVSTITIYVIDSILIIGIIYLHYYYFLYWFWSMLYVFRWWLSWKRQRFNSYGNNIWLFDHHRCRSRRRIYVIDLCEIFYYYYSIIVL